MAIEPVTREERFLAAAGGQRVTPPTPITRKEQLLQGIIDAVKSGGATPDVIENAVNKYFDANPVKPGATTEQAAQIEQNKTDIADLQAEVDELKESGGNGSGENAALTSAQIDLLEDAFEHIQWADEDGPQYAAQLIASLRGGESGGTEPEPEQPAKTLTSISAEYTGGNVPVGTAVSSLSGVTVTAHYSDGSTSTVTGYTLSGTIAEGDNTITVTYMGKATTITVTGEAQAADGRTLLHNWVLSDAVGSEIDTVGGAKVSIYQSIQKTADGWVNDNGWSIINCPGILSVNRTVEIDLATEFNDEGTNDIHVLFTLGDGSTLAQRYWLDYREKTNVWGWTDTSVSYSHAASIDGIAGADIFSGKTVALSINAAGLATLWSDGQYIGVSPFTVTDATQLNIGKNTEGFHRTAVSAIRVYEGVL